MVYVWAKTLTNSVTALCRTRRDLPTGVASAHILNTGEDRACKALSAAGVVAILGAVRRDAAGLAMGGGQGRTCYWI